MIAKLLCALLQVGCQTHITASPTVIYGLTCFMPAPDGTQMITEGTLIRDADGAVIGASCDSWPPHREGP